MAEKNKKCCLCDKTITGFGNNAEPLKKGICCNNCNTKVIMYRIYTMYPITIKGGNDEEQGTNRSS